LNGFETEDMGQMLPRREGLREAADCLHQGNGASDVPAALAIAQGE
jgi:hypothetical protein